MRLLYIAFPNSVHTLKWINHFKKNNDIMLASFYPVEPIDGIEVRYLHLINKNLAPMKVPEIRDIIFEFKPDILHAHYVSSCGVVAALSGFHPYVLSVWGDDILVFPHRSPIHKWMIRKTIKSADYVTATSQMLADSTNVLLGEKREITVIPFGVDLDHFQFKQRKNKDIIQIGTVRILAPKYGLEYLIKAVAKLDNAGYKIKLTIVGEGESRSQLESLTRQLNLADIITFTGFIPNKEIVKLLHKFDIFVMPSVSQGETFGVAAVEAMATGLPVVASKIGGLPEVVDNNVTGLHIKPRDVNSLVGALKKYIDSPELRISHGIEGRNKVERYYDWVQNANCMAALYDRINNDSSGFE